VQGKFWAMHDLLLANQEALKRDDLIGYAARLGLDRAKFTAALDAHTYRSNIDADVAEAKSQGVFGVPRFLYEREAGRRRAGPGPLQGSYRRRTGSGDEINHKGTKAQRLFGQHKSENRGEGFCLLVFQFSALLRVFVSLW
jgi:DSBA-like thioredoxin domain